MKETIKYYYNIDTDNIEEENGKYHFKIQNKDYFFVLYNRDIKELNDILECNLEMQKKGIKTHNIVLNVNKSVLTKINDFNYILFEVSNPLEMVDIFQIVELSNRVVLNNKYSSLYRNNWGKLWASKVDYYEYQIRELALEKEVIKNSFTYYIGLAENAISYVNNINSKYHNLPAKISLAHRRIFFPNYAINYYNPLSFVFDLEVRDIAEYLKSLFFCGDSEETNEELISYLKISNLNAYDYNMLYARLLYPSYYFDVYDEVMNKDRKEEDLIKIISKNQEYELFLKKAYLEISKYAPLEKIDWLIY